VYERTRKEAALLEAHRVGRSLSPLNGSTQYVPGVGDVLSRVVLIGEAPGRDEDRLGEPFVGRAGKELNSALEIIGVPRESVYITNVVKYRPPNNRKPNDEEIHEWLPILNREIAIIEPIAVLLMGATALKAVVGSTHISSNRGKDLDSPWPCLVQATYHPSYINYGGISREEWRRDFEKFFERALTFLPLPNS
jgi:uracil-DNA glycosylase family 4